MKSVNLLYGFVSYRQFTELIMPNKVRDGCTQPTVGMYSIHTRNKQVYLNMDPRIFFNLIFFLTHGSVHHDSMLIKRSNLMQQYADIYLLHSHSTCLGHHSTHHQEY